MAAVQGAAKAKHLSGDRRGVAPACSEAQAISCGLWLPEGQPDEGHGVY